MQKTLAELAAKINAEIKGDSHCIITGVSTLQSAEKGHLSFLSNAKYRQYLSATKASAVILTKDCVGDCPVNALIVEDPYYAYSQLAKEFIQLKKASPGIHSTAVIGNHCKIDPSASIAAHVVIDDNVIIEAHSQIGSGCVIGEGCHIGKDSHLWANVTLYHGVKLGNQVIVHSGVVIGADGFGIAQHQGKWHKIPQLGAVIIEDDVEIGANTTIDRGAIDNTVIETGVKLDNQIQVGHNVRIGAHTVIAGCAGISGSTHIGKHCMVGGGAGFGGHLKIADHSIVIGMSMVTSSIKEAGIYSSGTGLMKHREWLKNVARFRHLDKIIRQLQGK